MLWKGRSWLLMICSKVFRLSCDLTEKLLFQETLKLMLNALADDLIMDTGRRVRQHGIQDLEGIRGAPERLAGFSTEMEQHRREAKEFLYRNLYLCDDLKRAHEQAAQVIADLFAAWMGDPTLLPPSYANQVDEEGAPRVIADYIAGMTDHFVLEVHRSVRKMAVPSRS